jgi:eukaryotic-like serine/threonine-protein kinase
MAGRYKILDQLGVGGAGAVFKAYDTQLNRYVAIKRLLTKEEIEKDDGNSGGLKQEAASLATLQHPNIVSIYDLASDDEGFFIVMELLDGETLGDWINSGALSLPDFYDLATQTLEAILTAHHQSILHRDLKPENIKMVRLPGGRLQVKVLDFGLARQAYGARKMTEDQRGNIQGSIYYMAPEQFLRKPVDGRTDLYALGCLFYQLLSGRRPFEDASVAGIMERHLQHQVYPLHEIAPQLPGPLCDWVMWLMNLDPGNRPANAQQALGSLREIHQAGWLNPPALVDDSQPPMAVVIERPVRKTTSTQPRKPTAHTPGRPTTSAIPQAAQSPAPPGFVRTATGALVPAGGTPVRVAKAKAQPLPVAPETKRGIPLWIWPVAGVVILGGAWFFWPKKNSSIATTAPASAPAPSQPEPSKTNPWDRPRDLVLNNTLLQYGAAEKRENIEGNNGKSGDLIRKWIDLSGRGGLGHLVAYGSGSLSCPKLIQEKDDAFRFYPHFLRFESGQGMMHSLSTSASEIKDYPMGANQREKGVTVFMLVRPRISGNEITCLTLRDAENKNSLVIKAYANNEFKAFFQVGTSRGEAKVTGRNTKQFNLISLVWNATTNKVNFTVRTQDGNKSNSFIDPPKNPSPSVLTTLQISRDRAENPKSEDTFTGDIAELVIWGAPMTFEDRNLQDYKYSQFYFKNPGSRY